MTRTGSGLLVEEVNQLRALTIGQPADGLRLADAARVEEARGLHTAELWDRHQDVDHLCGLDELRRSAEDRLDPYPSVLEILLQLCALDTHVVGAFERVHTLVERTNGSMCGLGGLHGQAPDTSNVQAAIKPPLLRASPACFRRHELMHRPVRRPAPQALRGHAMLRRDR